MLSWWRKFLPALGPVVTLRARYVAPAKPLSQRAPGTRVRIKRIPPGLSCAQRLRELGLVEGAEVLLLRRSDPVLLALLDSRIAIERSVADALEVEDAV